jgi:hypothetical protein
LLAVPLKPSDEVSAAVEFLASLPLSALPMKEPAFGSTAMSAQFQNSSPNTARPSLPIRCPQQAYSQVAHSSKHHGHHFSAFHPNFFIFLKWVG